MIVYILLLVITTATAYFVHKPGAAILGGRKETAAGRLSARRCGGFTRQWFINRVSLCGIFLMLFGVSACRYMVGNDYSRYEEYFYNIYYGYVVPTEWGFNRFVKGMELLFGRDCYLLLFAVFAFLTVFLILKALYTLGEYFAFSFFLFMAFGYYYQSMNTVRYYLAVAAALYAITFLMRKSYGKFILFVLLAAMMHKSVIVVIPIYLLAMAPWKRWQVILVSLLAASGLFLGDFYLKIILYLYPTYRDTMYLEGGTSYINIARCAVILIFCLIYYTSVIRENRQLIFYFRLNIGALMLYVCGSFLPEVSRIGTYMTVTQVLLLPGVACAIPDKRQRRLAVSTILLAGTVYFAAFLYKAYGPLVKLLPYHTWLF